LDWARVSGFRSGENPARWRGHLDHLLPPRAKLQKTQHHSALPYARIGSFMKELRSLESVFARALEFTILTGVRTGDVRGALWQEIDLNSKIWTIPAERMKAGAEHRVPLSTSAMAVINVMREASSEGYVFPGERPGRPISNSIMLSLLVRMGYSEITVHGFRSTFKDWASEQTTFQNEVSEMALAHKIENKVEAAYRRSELLDKRRKLMEAWAAYCGRDFAKSADVVSLAEARRA
jgi:integrase